MGGACRSPRQLSMSPLDELGKSSRRGGSPYTFISIILCLFMIRCRDKRFNVGSRIVSVRLDDDLLKLVDELVKIGIYSSRSEVLRSYKDWH